jgi:ABC-2 type transport system ATP-binding protein
MEEVERVCERVGIMDRGCLLTLGDVDALVATHAGKTVVIAETEAGEKRIEADTSEAAISMLSDVTGVKSFRTENADLETVFLNLTGRKLRD